jgi:hypothetical protein
MKLMLRKLVIHLQLSALALGCASCVNQAREACYAESRARFVVDQESCEAEASRIAGPRKS